MNKATITLTAQAYWRLQWLCHRTTNEVSAMGLLAPAGEGVVIEDFILVKQEVGPAHVSLDMHGWADKSVELFDTRGIEPWRTSVWAHSHPAGMDRPSTTDEQTMAESFGGWNFILMLILTKDGKFYARMDVDHDFGGGAKQRLSVPCAVVIDWGTAGKDAVTETLLQAVEEEFRACVNESAERGWLFLDDIGMNGTRRPKKSPARGIQMDPSDPDQQHSREEVRAYVAVCHSQGLDPDDPDNFESYFGFEYDAEVLFGD